MVLPIAILITLLLYSAILSQPLFYWLALARASRKLSGSAYVEMRQFIDFEMESRGRIFYYLCLASCAALTIWLAVLPFSPLFPAAAFALAMLVGDVVISIRKNVPINKTINAWDRRRLPENWSSYRHSWLQIYRIRQWLLLAGYVIFLAGVLICI